jgi:hypothetical protein
VLTAPREDFFVPCKKRVGSIRAAERFWGGFPLSGLTLLIFIFLLLMLKK